jgi:uncharacterized membrane protein YeaQ/YmgE (transglycosylase-associated protein family)
MGVIIWLIVAIIVVWVGLHVFAGLVSLATSLVIGAVAGWLAGTLMRGRGFGVLKNILVGIVGGVIGRTLVGLLGLHGGGLIASIATATVGAIVLLAFVRWLHK